MVVSRSAPQQAPRGWALALTAGAFFMASLDLLAVITVLPAIQRDLRASMATLEWTVNAYSLASAAGIITAAALGDRFGRRRIFVLGLSLFTAASAACALALSAGFLIAARAIQGIGGAMVTPTALTILVSAFPPVARRSRCCARRCPWARSYSLSGIWRLLWGLPTMRQQVLTFLDQFANGSTTTVRYVGLQLSGLSG